jgi:CheY-like chemotaxis protein
MMREAADSGPPCILVIDECAGIVDLIRDVLEYGGCGTVGTTEPAQALRMAERGHPDLFVIDLTLGHTTGFELLAQLRSMGYPDTPAIGISGSDSWVRHAQSSGLFQAAIPKPFDLDELLAEVGRLTGWARVDSNG